ncbi:MAG: ATP-binding protein [Sumerlaeia bacterium]
MTKIKRRERDAVLQSLQAGLVPKQGLHLIQVGRKQEVQAVLSDFDRAAEGGAGFRLVVGRFGSGKSFFLNLMRTQALARKLVVAQADMSMERRLQASGGQAQNLYAELMRNLAIKSKPDGGALRNLVEGWVSSVHHEVTSTGGSEADVRQRIVADLRDLQDFVGGFEFAEVLGRYYDGHVEGDEGLQTAALRWLRAEYSTKTEARKDLGVRRIIGDENFYDSLKLMAAFCAKAGYSGMVVCLDELVVLSHRLPSSRARKTNYEAILTMLNDCLQGSAANIGFILAGTDEFVDDERRGLASYEALRTRLSGNQFAGNGVVDYSGPVIRLQNLTPEDLFVLLQNIRNVHSSGDPANDLVPDACIMAVLQKANETLGAEFYKTPRDVIRSFVGLLNVLEQNPGTSWEDLLGQDNVIQKPAHAQSVEEEVAIGIGAPDDEDDDLGSLRL